MIFRNHHIHCNIKMMRLLLYLFFVIALSNCSISQKIYLKADGSATIFASEEETEEVKEFYNSDQITNLKWGSNGGINFNIKKIDSLGNYLSPAFNKNIFSFKLKDDSLFFIQNAGLVFENSDCILTSTIEILPERKIKEIQTSNDGIKQKNNRIIIKRSRKNFTNMLEKINLQIIFD